ncbi:hypothetical protein [Cohnella sp. AR92]|uniref:hypothetical protein n=1 Tax=Cohnella sp. AR92 TaxID=648716 RepID=UPI000F8D48C2|nr:hypothetical protein [Cohnella sp. AR92]RUS44586.1 hypothetical protein ELR57_22650 [Cohnella sp. AR92]
MLLRHICEVCGKEEILTPDQAHEQGWDYPPMMGQFKMISPRTCGSCPIDRTLWWAIQIGEDLSEKQHQTLERILNEPDSIKVID